MGAGAVLSLRSIHASRRLDEFWRDHVNDSATTSYASSPGEYFLAPLKKKNTLKKNTCHRRGKS